MDIGGGPEVNLRIPALSGAGDSAMGLGTQCSHDAAESDSGRSRMIEEFVLRATETLVRTPASLCDAMEEGE